jgi:hypothetical protein
MLKPPEFDDKPICGPIICPVMSGRSIFPIGVNSSPAGLKGPGIQELQLIKADKLVYCQLDGCAWYRQEFGECVIHAIMNFRTLVDLLRGANFNLDTVRSKIEKAKAGIAEEK